MDNLPIQFASNFISIILVGVLIYSFLKHKKGIDVIAKLDELKEQNLLTQDDINYISKNEKNCCIINVMCIFYVCCYKFANSYKRRIDEY